MVVVSNLPHIFNTEINNKLTFNFGRVIIVRVGSTGRSVDPAVAQSLNNYLVRNVQRQHCIDVEEFLQLGGLVGGARKAIKKNRLASRQSGKFLLEDVQHNFVRNKLASLHVRLSGQTNLSLLSDVFTQQVARGNLWKE